MNINDHERLKDLITSAMPSLGRASKPDNGYFRFQKSLGSPKSAKTTVAVYFRDVGGNLLELAFDVDATAECIQKPRGEIVRWLTEMRAFTGQEVHPNPRYAYSRIGISKEIQLIDILAKWTAFVAKSDEISVSAIVGPEVFVSVPFFVESDGTSICALFSPVQLERSKCGDENVDTDSRSAHRS